MKDYTLFLSLWHSRHGHDASFSDSNEASITVALIFHTRQKGKSKHSTFRTDRTQLFTCGLMSTLVTSQISDSLFLTSAKTESPFIMPCLCSNTSVVRRPTGSKQWHRSTICAANEDSKHCKCTEIKCAKLLFWEIDSISWQRCNRKVDRLVDWSVHCLVRQSESS